MRCEPSIVDNLLWVRAGGGLGAGEDSWVQLRSLLISSCFRAIRGGGEFTRATL